MKNIGDLVNSAVDEDKRDSFSSSDKMIALMSGQGIKNTLSIDGCGGLHIIDHAHHEIHEGDYWFADDISASLGLNATAEWLIVTPDEDIFLHSLPQITCTGESELQVYETVAVSTNGTEIPLLNRNRAIGGTTTFKFYKVPTGVNTTGAIIIRSIRAGAGKTISEVRSESELILKKNTKYLFRITSRVAGIFASIHINGYICPLA